MFERQPLGALIERQTGGGTPPRADAALWEGNIPWASVKDFADGSLELNQTEESITEAGLRASTSNLIPAGTPLVCTRMAVGRAAVAAMDVAINQDVRALFPTERTDSGYLLRLLASLQQRAESRSVGSTVKGIRTADYLALDVPVAPSEEQPIIARILDTLDTQIRQTEALIAKLEQIKQGLLTDLLTRGIDEHGQLRPPPKEAPHLYKDSPLGRIPNEWVCVPLGEVVPSADYGISSSLSGSGQVPVLRMNNLSKGEADLSDLKFAPRQAVGDLLLKPGDVLFNRTNSIEHVGRTGIWRGQIEVASFASYLVRLNNEPTRLIAEFLNIWLNFGYTQLRLRRFATPGVHQVNVNPTNLRRVLMALPGDIEEQRGIVTVLEAEDERLEAERRHQSKLVGQKSALLEDLLSGRVRVAPLLHGVEHAPS